MDVQEIYRQQPEPQQSCLYALRHLILAQNKLLVETVKYGMPCFCYGKKPFCYLWVDKQSKEPYVLMVKGQFMKHQALETGSRSRMKILRIAPDKDIPEMLVKEVLLEALALYEQK